MFSSSNEKKPSEALKKIIHDELVACYADLSFNKRSITSMDDLVCLNTTQDEDEHSEDIQINNGLLSFWDHHKTMSINEAIDSLLIHHETYRKNPSPTTDYQINRAIADHIEKILGQVVWQNLCSKSLISIIDKYMSRAEHERRKQKYDYTFELLDGMPVALKEWNDSILEDEPTIPTRSCCRPG